MYRSRLNNSRIPPSSQFQELRGECRHEPLSNPNSKEVVIDPLLLLSCSCVVRKKRTGSGSRSRFGDSGGVRGGDTGSEHKHRSKQCIFAREVRMHFEIMKAEVAHTIEWTIYT